MIWLYPITKENEDMEFSYESFMQLVADDCCYAFEETYDPARMLEYELLKMQPKKDDYVGYFVYDVKTGIGKLVKLAFNVIETETHEVFKVVVKTDE